MPTSWTAFPPHLSTIGSSCLYKWTFLFGLLFLLIANTHADTHFMSNEGVVLDSIRLSGNRSTRDFVLLSEIELVPGDTLTYGSVEQSRLRLESLGLFKRVECMIFPTSEGHADLVIEVSELWYLWPGMYLAVEEEKIEKSTYGLVLTHLNFRGRREKLSGEAWTGGANGFGFIWDIPYHSRQKQWFSTIEAHANFQEEPLYLANPKGITTEELFAHYRTGKWIDHNRRFQVETGLEMRKFSYGNGSRATTMTSGLRDWIGLLTIGYYRDTRHYRPWPTQGSYTYVSFRLGTSLDGPEARYIRPEAGWARYHELWNGTVIAGMVRGGITFGQSPMYSRFLSNRNSSLVRSGYDGVLEGTRFGKFSGEVRINLLPIRYITIPGLGNLSEYARDLRFGVSCVLFSDTGIIEGADEGINGERSYPGGWDVGYGIGIVFHVPYLEVVRFELARSAHFPQDGFTFRARVGAAF